MLQWMGGSRRKHSTKSIQNRQKQYFEQRRRLQQQQAPPALHDDIHQCTSLDILSLGNLAKLAQQPRNDAPQPTIHTDTLEFQDSGGNQVNTVSPNTTPLSYEHIDLHNHLPNKMGSKLSHWKSTDQQLSIIDLLGDDGWDGDLQVKRKNEDHVSFSVQGLGHVGSETPVHSPRQPGRDYSYGCSSPVKPIRRLQSSKNFIFTDDLEMVREEHSTFKCECVDAMMQDRDITSGGNAYQVPSYRKRVVNTLNHGFSTFDDCMQLDEDNSNTKSSFDNKDTFYGSRDFDDNIWNAGSSIRDCDYFEEKGHDYDFFEDQGHDFDFFEDQGHDHDFFEERRHDHDFFEEKKHDHDFFEEKKHDARWKKRSWQKDRDSVDTFRFSNETPVFTFEGPRPPEKRKTKRFNITEPPGPFYRHREPEPDDFVTSDFLGSYTAGEDFSFRDMSSHQNRGHFYTDGRLRNNLSSLSEESCSSTAVRGKIEKTPSMGKHSKNMSSRKVDGQRRESAKIHTNMSRSKAARDNNISLEDQLKSENSWLLEEEWQSAESNAQSLDVNFWDEDSLGAFTVSKMESSFQRSKHDVLSDYSQSGRGGLGPEKLAVCPPSSRLQFFETKGELSEDTKKQRRTSVSSDTGGCDGDSVHPDDVMKQEVVTGMEKLEKTASADVGGRSESEKDISGGNNEVLSESGQNMNRSDCESKEM